jgi:hypothetical protein
VRQVDLGLDLVGFTASAQLGGCGLGFGGGAKMRTNLLCFVFLDRTRVCLFLGNSDFSQDVKDRLALDFQFPGQIVDSNLTHPPFLGPATAP